MGGFSLTIQLETYKILIKNVLYYLGGVNDEWQIGNQYRASGYGMAI